ncbi:15922_t:CDS:2 [Funneliformis geosporum]|uniref:17962_t:CDS:1 n=1 Tax=Funneliformis geosporum TaxID=1117311 RepID=A0A9W4SAI3_9GLOM|nr:17962_t:CDS:2 [Funneliformis geosporum]CAI2178432.1 15922_t:CDS:2 [Funneliformis geosporum]
MTGKKLMKKNILVEAARIRLNNRYIINLVTDHLWDHHLMDYLKNQFTTFADRINSINPYVTSHMNALSRIRQIPDRQNTNSVFQDQFFHGSSFEN